MVFVFSLPVNSFLLLTGMPVKKIDIQEFLNRATDKPVFDVRSPGEFDHAHFPGAQNLPLFSNEERKIIGISYKLEGRETAIKKGLDFFGPKMRKMIEEAETLVKKNDQDNRTVLVSCWRGGMRSAAIAWLLDLYGFDVYQLSGGYKTFRQWVLEQFDKTYSFRTVGGYTGSGKTKVLEQLTRLGHNVIDLEGLANHKGSAFGALGEKPQPSQEMFENLLALELERKVSEKDLTWLEDESQRIGQLAIPMKVWEQMRTCPVYFLDISFEERLKYLVETYGKYPKEGLINAILRISKKLGGLETKNAINFLIEKDTLNSFRILLNYYDKLYTKGLQNRQDLSRLLTKVGCVNVDVSANTVNFLNKIPGPIYGNS